MFLDRNILFKFDLFGKSFTITTFGICLGLGVLILAWIFLTGVKRLKNDNKRCDNVLYYSLMIGALTYLAAVFFDALWHSIAEGVSFSWSNGGMTFEGGVLTGLLTYMILWNLFIRFDKGHVLNYTDILVVGILIAHAFGRIGCFHAGCCYGKMASELPTWLQWLAVPYHTGNAPYAYQDAERVLTQLIESGFLIIVFVLFLTVIKKHRTELYLIIYGVYRFFAEYLRGDSRGSSPFKDLSPSQFFSILFVVSGIIIFFYRAHMYKKDQKEYDALEDKSTYVKKIKSYRISYKGLIKGLTHKCTCPECNEKCKIHATSDTISVSNIEEMYKYHLVKQCPKCLKEYEIK